MDTCVYEVCFPDGRTEELVANTIAAALYTQCNPDGSKYILLDTIMDFRKNPHVAISWNGQSMYGWELCCEWKDGSTSWQKLSNIKESHPLQVAEFALALCIANEPAFNCWVSWVLKKRYQIISLAYAIDKATGTTFLCNSIKLEVKIVWVAFDVLPDGVAPPSGHQYIKCHMIFDVKMEDFCCKALLIAGGHMTKAPATLT
ncbi:hypothetical protein ACHAW6_000113 [Cyclotella cf. meneghiniana]